MILKKINFFSVIFFLFFTNNLFSNINNKIIVKVEDKIITNYELKNKILTTLYLAGEEVNQKNIDKIKKPAVDALIVNMLKLIELDKRQVKLNNNRLNSYLNSISSNNIIEMKKNFEENLLDFELFEKETEIQIRWQEFIFKRYSNKINLDENSINYEIDQYLKTKKKFKEFLISELEINFNNSNEDKNILSDIKNEISTNGFGKTALKYSISSSSKKMGNLGWINEKSLSKEIFNIISKMEVGDVSQPIKRQNTFLFLKLEKIRSSNDENLDIEKLKKELIDQRKNELFNLYSKSHISKLKNTSFIEYK